MNKKTSQKNRNAAHTRRTPAALNAVKLTIEIPKNIMLIMQACASAQEITVEENVVSWLKAGLRCDVECFESDCAGALKSWTEGAAK